MNQPNPQNYPMTAEGDDAYALDTERWNEQKQLAEVKNLPRQWIRVEDELPKSNVSLYLTDGTNVCTGMHTVYNHQPLDGSEWEEDVVGFAGFNLGIEGDMGRFDATHWMYEKVPSPPQAPHRHKDG